MPFTPEIIQAYNALINKKLNNILIHTTDNLALTVINRGVSICISL